MTPGEQLLWAQAVTLLEQAGLRDWFLRKFEAKDPRAQEWAGAVCLGLMPPAHFAESVATRASLGQA